MNKKIPKIVQEVKKDMKNLFIEYSPIQNSNNRRGSRSGSKMNSIIDCLNKKDENVEYESEGTKQKPRFLKPIAACKNLKLKED